MRNFLYPIADPISLDDLAGRIRKSSNFRFAWQFYAFEHIKPSSANDVRKTLETVIAEPSCHRFLSDTFNDMYDQAFQIVGLHDHCQVVEATDSFENIMASAGNDRLGAYSCNLRDAVASEKDVVRRLFESLGPYQAFQVVLYCDICQDHADHLFTNWFYGVVWDWCFLLTWAKPKLLWMGCLTDTD
jgi:hypothetical protein